jgi:hypothetical protein
MKLTQGKLRLCTDSNAIAHCSQILHKVGAIEVWLLLIVAMLIGAACVVAYHRLCAWRGIALHRMCFSWLGGMGAEVSIMLCCLD